jgi:hypothetical protein
MGECGSSDAMVTECASSSDLAGPCSLAVLFRYCQRNGAGAPFYEEGRAAPSENVAGTGHADHGEPCRTKRIPLRVISSLELHRGRFGVSIHRIIF